MDTLVKTLWVDALRYGEYATHPIDILLDIVNDGTLDAESTINKQLSVSAIYELNRLYIDPINSLNDIATWVEDNI